MRRRPALIAGSVLTGLALLAAVEGIASLAHAIRESSPNPVLAEHRHTEYDSELGWVNQANVYLPNMYGPGLYLRTNAQRFRNDSATAARIPVGRRRAICVGDSFTLGFGVDNAHAWPERLAAHIDRLEAVNMGQGGYGSDQAYLWYRRDGVALDHDVCLFATGSLGFERMQSPTFAGYGKPMLAVADGRLEARNVPVPGPRWSSARARIQRAADNLNTVRALRRLFRLDDRQRLVRLQRVKEEETRRVAEAMFDDLARLARDKRAALVLVYLPLRGEYEQDEEEPWRPFIHDYARSRGIALIDVVDDLRRLPPNEVDAMFITKAAADLPGLVGHYSERGNDFVAGAIARSLTADPRVAAHLQPRP